jgi:EAL domain-containing protein (putative c-di-GMP-specific phosphodiesterase class I)
MVRDGERELCAFEAFDHPFSMAFQPIVDLRSRQVRAYEALVRGPGGEGALSVLNKVNLSNRHAFELDCQRTAIQTAARLGLAGEGAMLSINVMPNAVQDPEADVEAALAAARRADLPADRLIFEFTEIEPVETAHLDRLLGAYRRRGLKTAMDDFGAGYSGLTLLAKVQPDVVKLDMELVRGIDSHRAKQVLVAAFVGACRELSIEVVAEGIETLAEHAVLNLIGVTLQQGYLFARPGFEALAKPQWPVDAAGVLAA